MHPAKPGVLGFLRQGLVKNSLQETKNPWLSRMDEDLTIRNSGLRPANCILWRLATPKMTPAYCKEAGINFVGREEGRYFSRYKRNFEPTTTRSHLLLF